MVPDVRVDAAIHKIQHAGLERACSIPECRHAPLQARKLGGLAQGSQIALSQSKADADGLDLGDRHQAGGIVDAHEIARGHANRADAAGNRCFELGVSKLQRSACRTAWSASTVCCAAFKRRSPDPVAVAGRRSSDKLLLAPQVGLRLRKSRLVLRELASSRAIMP